MHLNFLARNVLWMFDGVYVEVNSDFFDFKAKQQNLEKISHFKSLSREFYKNHCWIIGENITVSFANLVLKLEFLSYVRGQSHYNRNILIKTYYFPPYRERKVKIYAEHLAFFQKISQLFKL